MIKKRRQYRACEYCGAALDPGERCECRKIKTYEEQHGLRLLHDTKKMPVLIAVSTGNRRSVFSKIRRLDYIMMA